jgi:hypothetical protein
MADQGSAPGWYDHHGGKRFHDGEKWTEHYAYTGPLQARRGFELFVIVLTATFLGMLLALSVVWVGAQLLPDDIYLPVKVVVETPDLPLLP